MDVAQGPPVGGTHPCPMGLLSATSDTYKIIPNEKTLTPKDFPKYDTELHRHRRQVSGVQKVVFRHPVGTGIDHRSHLHQGRCFP